MNVLVLGVGSNVSQGIVKALRRINDIPIRIIGACVCKTSVGLYLCDEALFMPFAADEGFISWYIKTCKEKEIDITFTGVEENIDVLVRNRSKIESECIAQFVYPTKEAWEIGADKYCTCKWLQEHDLPYPAFCLASDDKGIARLIAEVGFPLIAKPRGGKSSTGIITAYSLRELTEVLGKEDYVIQEHIGSDDDEFTIGCYFTKTGEFKSSITMHRYLKNGGTSMAEIVSDRKINELIDQIAKGLYATGPLNIQIRKRNDGAPVCIEWNVRYSGATAIRNHFGFCDVEAAIREYVLSESINNCFHVVKKGTAIRAEEEHYFEGMDFERLFWEKGL